MAKNLILHGRVQGVCCRAYCSQYARKHRIRGIASNMPNGTVRVILNTDDMDLINRFISDIKTNPNGFTFYGEIETIDVNEYSGPVRGEYQF